MGESNSTTLQTGLAKARLSSYVCVVNVHMVVEAWQDPGFASVVNCADLATPDGMPLVMSLRLLHGITQERVAGMDLVPDLIAAAEQKGLSIFLYGSHEDVLNRMTERIGLEHPAVNIAGSYSPPFRSLSEEEEREVIERINSSGTNILLVALGCPKQEKWMARHKGRIDAVMVGVGGAFSVYAGIQKRAPLWMQKASLEWFYRLIQEPHRLFVRYLKSNLLFVGLLARAMLNKASARRPS